VPPGKFFVGLTGDRGAVYAKGRVRYWILALWTAGCMSAASLEGRDAAGHPSAHTDSAGPIDPHKTQLLTVVSDDWNAFQAILRRYERLAAGWREVGAPVQVVLGHAGYGWGRGLHGNGTPPGRGGPVKREGDGRSPAGVFELGPVYGYESPPAKVSLAYVEATPTLRCVDDPASLHYNRIVSTFEQGRDWQSAELMLRGDDLYEIAIFVEHNAAPPAPGDGSCIFLHVWEGPDVAVRGCTAMAKPALRALSEWLRPGAAVLVALPEHEYDALRSPWNLPPQR
jgi:D-alanyl-D-alanine dipeptidase